MFFRKIIRIHHDLQICGQLFIRSRIAAEILQIAAEIHQIAVENPSDHHPDQICGQLLTIIFFFFEAFCRTPGVQPSLIKDYGRDPWICGHYLTVIHQHLTPASDCGRNQPIAAIIQPQIIWFIKLPSPFCGRERKTSRDLTIAADNLQIAAINWPVNPRRSQFNQLSAYYSRNPSSIDRVLLIAAENLFSWPQSPSVDRESSDFWSSELKFFSLTPIVSFSASDGSLQQSRKEPGPWLSHGHHD